MVVSLLIVILLGLRLTVFIGLITITLLVIPALVALWVLLRRLTVRLPLLLRLVHGIQDAKVMFGVLKECFRRHSVATAGRVASELKILFEELLGSAANADLGPVAVEDVVTIKRDPAA